RLMIRPNENAPCCQSWETKRGAQRSCLSEAPSLLSELMLNTSPNIESALGKAADQFPLLDVCIPIIADGTLPEVSRRLPIAIVIRLKLEIKQFVHRVCVVCVKRKEVFPVVNRFVAKSVIKHLKTF